MRRTARVARPIRRQVDLTILGDSPLVRASQRRHPDWGWGDNRNGQVGIGVFTTGEILPQQVVNLTDVLSIGGGEAFAFAIQNDGTVWAWGRNSSCALGTANPRVDTPRPERVEFDWLPPEQGNVLRAVKVAGDVQLTFDGGQGPREEP